MGNLSSTQDRSICGLNFFSAKDLHQTTLKVPPVRKQGRSQTSIPVTKENTATPSSSNDHILTKKGKSSDDVPVERLILQRGRSHTYFSSMKDIKEKPIVNENDFRILQKLAKGRYGKICIVKKDDGDKMFAMKVLCKKKINFQRRDEVVMIEKEILEKANHPFIPKLVYSFENERNHFLVVEFIEGGELHKILKQLTRFSEEITKFYSAEVLVALEYLHDYMGVKYNDLKPENILLDSQGHIRLIDFDLAEKIEDAKSLVLSKNKPDSPGGKIQKETSSDRMIDYWTFGCFIYELLAGKKLFPHRKSGSRVVEEHILEDDMEWPQSISKNAKDLITRLLHPKPEERLGYHDIQEIKKHPFFAHINWEKIQQKSMYPPLDPGQFKENPKEEEEEQESEAEITETDEVNKCSLGFILDHEETKGETITVSGDLSYRKTPVGGSHPEVSDNSLARSS